MVPEMPSLGSDSSGSSSDDSSEASESSPDERDIKPLIRSAKELPESLDNLIPYVHRTSAVLHCRNVDHTRLKCGRNLTVTYSKASWTGTDRILRCAQCFR